MTITPSYDPTRPNPARSESLTSSDKPFDRQLEAALADQAQNGEISELVVVAEGEERVTWFIWVLIACSSISGLLFGAHGFRTFICLCWGINRCCFG